METTKLQMASHRRRQSLTLPITKASNYKESPPLTAWIKPLDQWSRTAISTTWVPGMDEADTCAVRVLEVAVDIGAEVLRCSTK